MALPVCSSTVSTRPKVGPARRSTIAAKARPWASEMYLSHGSAWMPRVTPTSALNATLFWTISKGGKPWASSFARWNPSLNQPRPSECTTSSIRSRPGIEVASTLTTGGVFQPRSGPDCQPRSAPVRLSG